MLTVGTWGGKETMWDSFSNVEVVAFYNANNVPVIATTKGYWPSGSPVMELISLVDPASYLFADSDWTIDRGMAWVTTINSNKVLRVQGFNHATEPVVGGTGQRAWVSKNVTIADGEWSVIARTTNTGADFRLGSRYTDASNHYAWIWNSTNKDQWFERANQTYATIGTQNTGTTIAANTDYTCLMTLSGSSFSASINAVARGTGSDATIASGKIALGSAFLSASLPVYYRNVLTPGNPAGRRLQRVIGPDGVYMT